MSAPPNIFRLRASANNYDWGKPGHVSLVAKFVPGAVGTDTIIDGDKPYAELWMGTHPNGPSVLWTDPSTSLRGLIESSPPSFLGKPLTTATFTKPAKFPQSTHVPFLFKVLSIARALPLQAHPDKKLAEQLHKKDPKQFVDSNHKPEIAVAVADGFRGFVGFAEPTVIQERLETISQLRAAIDDDESVSSFLKDPSTHALKDVFAKLLTRNADDVAVCVEKLVNAIGVDGASAVGGDAELADVVKLLHQQYGGDVGVLAAPFFMNLITLKRGEAVYIGADEIHAYLEGDIIECMAVSDNVLNAAFVPPSDRQTDSFINSLTYTARGPSNWSLPQTSYKKSQLGKTVAFDPPLEEFTVLWTCLEPGGRDYNDHTGREILEAVTGPTIGIVIRGQIKFSANGGLETLEGGEGAVLFVRPGNEVCVEAVEGEGEGEVWWATCDV